MKKSQIFIDPTEIATEENELERLEGKIQYEKLLHTRDYKPTWELIRACASLSPIQRVIVALRFFENNAEKKKSKKGYSYRRIGKKLGMPRMTVCRRLKDALFKYRLWAERYEIK